MDLSPEMKHELDQRLTRLAQRNESDPATESLQPFDRFALALLFFGSLAIVAYKIAGF